MGTEIPDNDTQQHSCWHLKKQPNVFPNEAYTTVVHRSVPESPSRAELHTETKLCPICSAAVISGLLRVESTNISVESRKPITIEEALEDFDRLARELKTNSMFYLPLPDNAGVQIGVSFEDRPVNNMGREGLIGTSLVDIYQGMLARKAKQQS